MRLIISVNLAKNSSRTGNNSKNIVALRKNIVRSVKFCLYKNMVYKECVLASQFRIALNEDFVWQFLRENYERYYHLNVKKIAELCEDALNLVNLLENKMINVDKILRLEILKEYKRCATT